MQQPPQPLQQALCSTAVAAAGGEGDGSLAPCLQGPAAQAPADQQREAPGEAQELAVELAAAAAAATGGPCQQAATDGSGGAGPASPAAEEDDEEEGVEDVKEDGEFDAELATWLAGRLQRMQPGAELTTGSVKVLGKLLDEITVRVLEEAQRVSAGCSGANACGSGASGADPAAAWSAAADTQHAAPRQMPASTAAMQQQQQQEQQHEEEQQQRRGRVAASKLSALTSLDIHKALKRVLPGEPAENKLRPYLPAVTKQAWHLDKQSLKGIKRQKQAAATAGAAPAAAPAPAPPESAKENEGRQPQAAGA